MTVCMHCSNQALAGGSRCREHGGRRRSKGRGLYGRHHEEKARIILKGSPVCHLCGRGAEAIPELGPFQADHVVPLSLGGSLALSNMAPAHRKCNIAKGGANRKRTRA